METEPSLVLSVAFSAVTGQNGHTPLVCCVEISTEVQITTSMQLTSKVYT